MNNHRIPIRDFNMRWKFEHFRIDLGTEHDPHLMLNIGNKFDITQIIQITETWHITIFDGVGKDDIDKELVPPFPGFRVSQVLFNNLLAELRGHQIHRAIKNDLYPETPDVMKLIFQVPGYLT